MTESLENKGILEKKSGEGYGYQLKDEELFSQLGYKVLLSQKVSGLLKAAKVCYNGRIQLMYFSKDYKTCRTILSGLPFDSILMVCSRILETIIRVKEHGFLFCENIDISMDHILFDPKTYEAYLIYLPLVSGNEMEKAQFDMELRHTLLQIVKMNAMAASKSELQMIQMLNDSRVEIEKILEFTLPFVESSVRGRNIKRPGLRLVSMNPNLQLTFIVDKPRFTIGRRKDNDGVLDFWEKISRLHCSIAYDRDTSSYLIEDEGSSLGTMLNGKLLVPHVPQALGSGDVVALPGIKLKVCQA